MMGEVGGKSLYSPKAMLYDAYGEVGRSSLRRFVVHLIGSSISQSLGPRYRNGLIVTTSFVAAAAKAAAKEEV